MLEVVIEGMEKVFDMFWKWTFILIWNLRESVVAVFAVFIYGLIYDKIEKVFSAKMLTIAFAIIFIFAVLVVIVLGLLAVFGGTGFFLTNPIYEFFLTTVIMTVTAVVLAVVDDALGWMEKLYAWVAELTGITTSQTWGSAGGIMLMFLGIWYVMFRLLRSHLL